MMEVGLVMWEDNGYREADIDESAPIRMRMYDGDSESEVVVKSLSDSRRQGVNVKSVEQNASRTQSNRTLHGISCADKPAIYWEIFSTAFYAAMGSFVGVGIGSIKGCVAAAVTTGAGYFACVGAAASFAAIVGGSITFGVLLLQMQNACSANRVIEPTLMSSASREQLFEPTLEFITR